VSEKVVISYQGARFRLGRGQTFFAVWSDGAPTEEPLERWPATPEGWSAAWSRFNELETPGSIVAAQVTQASRSAAPVLTGFKVTNSSALLVIGVVFGAVGLFPDYWSGATLLSASYLWVPHLLYLIAWAVAAVGVLAGGGRARAAALLAVGTSAVTLGLFVTDIGSLTSGSSAGAGLVLSCIGWVAATAGAVLALRSNFKLRELLTLPRGGALGGAILLVLAAIGVIVAFIPGWDNETIASSSTGAISTVTNANAFSGAALIVIGNVLVMIAVALTVIAAGAWRRVRDGAALLAGAAIVMIAQAVSAILQSNASVAGEKTQASQEGYTYISSGLNAWFWVYCLFAMALLISCLWMLFSAPALSAEAAASPAVSPTPTSDLDSGSEVDSDSDSDDSDSDSAGPTFHDPDNGDTDILAAGDAPAV
jgi:hypothetical protein